MAVRLRAAPSPIPRNLWLVIAIGGLAALYEWLVVVLTPSMPGAIGLNYNALGTDFMVYHEAGRAILDHNPSILNDGDRFTASLNADYSRFLSRPLEFRPWVYPPSYLLVVVPLALLGFPLALLAFEALTAAALAAALAIDAAKPLRHRLAMAGIVLLSPAAAANVACGQNAFLFAALAVAGLRYVGPAPWLGGGLLGLITMKPQFAVLVPIALIAARNWRSLAAAGISACAAIVLSVALFGSGLWVEFVSSTVSGLSSARSAWVETGRMWGLSTWTCARLLGLPGATASFVQLIFSLVALAGVVVAFNPKSKTSADIRIAVFLVATCLFAPYWSLYDATFLAVAAILWWHERVATEKDFFPAFMALLLWMLPAVSPPMIAPPSRLTPLLLLAFLVVALRQTERKIAVAPSASLTSQL